MRNPMTTQVIRWTAVTLLIASALTGCMQTKKFMSSLGDESPAEEPIILGAPDAEVYLDELYQLAEGQAAVQAEIFADAQAGAKIMPGPQTNLRLALVLATPGHSEFNPDTARRMLLKLLGQPELLTAPERALAALNLLSVERQIALRIEAQRAEASSSRAAATEEAAINQRLANAEAENERLRRELADAEEKLDAITLIERSIREQEP